MKIQKYQPSTAKTWEGRIDSLSDPASFRWHQVVEPLDLHDQNRPVLKKDETGFCILGFGCDKGVEKNLGRTGTAAGPESIRKEMANLAANFGNKGRLFDAGNILCNTEKLEKSQQNLALATETIFQLGLIPVILGGGHEIAYGHYSGIHNYHKKHNPEKLQKTGIINFDSHFDIRPYHENGPNSGTMFRQIFDDRKKEELALHYFCLGIQKTGNTRRLFENAGNMGIKWLLAREIIDFPVTRIYDKLNVFISAMDQIYLTVCSDVFSSAFAPGVSSPQPLGLHPEIVLKFIKHIVRTGKVKSFDIAEVSPRFDNDNQTAKLASIIAYAVINTMLYPEDV